MPFRTQFICRLSRQESKRRENIALSHYQHDDGFANIISLKTKLRRCNDSIKCDVNSSQFMLAVFIPAFTGHLVEQLMNFVIGLLQYWRGCRQGVVTK